MPTETINIPKKKLIGKAKRSDRFIELLKAVGELEDLKISVTNTHLHALGFGHGPIKKWRESQGEARKRSRKRKEHPVPPGQPPITSVIPPIIPLDELF